jgi:DNA-binding HxlR family transcriptional regulator
MTPGHTDDTTGQVCAQRRAMLDRLGSRWSLLVVGVLADGPQRFNALRRLLGDVSQRMLSLTVRALERDGLVSRRVIDTVPPQVEYALTGLGQSFHQAVQSVFDWSQQHAGTMAQARAAYDAAVRNEPGGR